MRIIDLSDSTPASRVTVLGYGSMRSGKTRFAATFPRPLFLSDGTESGWTTIKNMDRNALYEPARLPQAWAIDRASDMMQGVSDAEQLIRTRPGEVLTLVIDSLTFYSDLYFAHLYAGATANGRTPDNRILYGNLGNHLRELRIRVHQLPVNVIWLCLDKTPDPENPSGGPMIPGQNGSKFAAGCDYIFYHRVYQTKLTDPLSYEIRTHRYGQYPAGGRDEGLLPDPLGYYAPDAQGQEAFYTDCTYRSLATALGLFTKTGSSQPAAATATTATAQAAPSTSTAKTTGRTPVARMTR